MSWRSFTGKVLGAAVFGIALASISFDELLEMVLGAAVFGIALALWSVGCADTSPVTVSEGSSEATEAMVPKGIDDDESTQEAQIRGLLEKFVEDGQSVGVVVGIVREGERIVIGAGRLADGDPEPPDGDTVFEIGSVAKVFTSTALADLEVSSGLGLETPVQSLLDEDVQVPTRDGTEITLGHLATHSSGLSRLPDNLDPADWTNPYADYTSERLYEFLADHEQARDIGEIVEYSNLGYGLLGHALALSEGADYETIIVRRILKPLEMADTAVNLTPPQKARMAIGHGQAHTSRRHRIL